MLKIQRSANGQVVLTLTGRIPAENVAELQRLLELEKGGRGLVLDLKDVTLVDRDAVKFLARCEADGIELKSCPAYIREWIERETGPSKQRNRRKD
jgi:anti-anti-sigma regulatory factor